MLAIFELFLTFKIFKKKQILRKDFQLAKQMATSHNTERKRTKNSNLTSILKNSVFVLLKQEIGSQRGSLTGLCRAPAAMGDCMWHTCDYGKTRFYLDRLCSLNINNQDIPFFCRHIHCRIYLGSDIQAEREISFRMFFACPYTNCEVAKLKLN